MARVPRARPLKHASIPCQAFMALLKNAGHVLSGALNCVTSIAAVGTGYFDVSGGLTIVDLTTQASAELVPAGLCGLLDNSQR
jgi:hypothetical protein